MLIRKLATAANRPPFLVGLFFFALTTLGLFLHRDYGVSCDEPFNRTVGNLLYNQLFLGGPPVVLLERGYDHANLLSLFMACMERLLNMTDILRVFQLRHLVCFALFCAATFCFFRLCRSHFGSWKWGLLGAFCLAASPRIFADAFYSPVDLPFLCLWVISMPLLLRFLDRKSWGSAAVLAAATAVLIGTRKAGVILPFLTLTFAGWEAFRVQGSERRALVLKIAFYLALSAGLTYLFSPVLWGHPLSDLARMVRQSTAYHVSDTVLYLGRVMKFTDVPRHYAPVWILISTPITYVVCAFFGLGALFHKIKSGAFEYADVRNRNALIFALWFVLPLMAAVLLRPTLYDGWRHLFFIYPALLLLGLGGAEKLWSLCQGREGWRSKKIGTILLALAVLDLLFVAGFMARNHPYQNVYFNPMIGGIRGAQGRFELDYWGLSYTEGLRRLVAEDSSNPLFVAVDRCGSGAFAMLPEADRDRTEMIMNHESAHYFMGTHKARVNDYPFPDKIHAVRVDGVEILSVYRMK